MNDCFTAVDNLTLQKCYDMRFAELSLALRNMGAQILTFPSAFTYQTGAAHWEVLLRARAIETQCYVVAAAQTGTHNKKRVSWGHAMVNIETDARIRLNKLFYYSVSRPSEYYTKFKIGLSAR